VPANNLSDRKCESVEWFTPDYVLGMVRRVFGRDIDLDPFSTKENPTMARRVFTKEDDALSHNWPLNIDNCFANPPYGKQLGPCISRVVESAEANANSPHALLLAASARWEQEYWWKIFSPDCEAMFLFRKRIRYLKSDGTAGGSPNYPSIMFFFNVGYAHLERAIEVPGRLIRITGGAVCGVR